VNLFVAFTNILKIKNICLCNDNQTLEYESRAKSLNVVYIKYTADNVQCPMQYWDNESTIVTYTFRELLPYILLNYRRKQELPTIFCTWNYLIL
jgi:hypothetical protein